MCQVGGMLCARSLLNAGYLRLKCVLVLHEGLLVLVLIYGSETVAWREKARSGIRALQMDSIRCFLGMRRIYRIRMHGIDSCFG